jgi:hypothetical protein
MTILARRLLRETAKGVIEAITGIIVESPGDWETAPARLPNIKLRAPNDLKRSGARTLPQFTSVVTLELLLTVQGDTAEAAQDEIESLGQQVEACFFSAQPLVQLCQQFPTVTTAIDISSDGKRHAGRATMRIDCEVFEAFDPTEINPADYPALQRLDVHVDTAAPFDATGTYPSPAFPASVTAAPRTSGPDGRDEGTLHIDLT